MIWALACTEEAALPPDVSGERPIVELFVVETWEPVPPRFTQDVTDPASWATIPPTTLRARLRADPELAKAFLSALAGSPNVPVPVLDHDGKDERTCALAREIAGARPEDGWESLTNCRDDASRALARSSPNPWALVRATTVRPDPWEPRLQDIAREAIRASDNDLLWSALAAITSASGPESAAAWVALFDEIPEEARSYLVLASGGRPERSIRAKIEGWCLARPGELGCGPEAPPSDPWDPEEVLGRGESLDDWLTSDPDHRTAKLDELEQCAAESSVVEHQRACAWLAASNGRSVVLPPDLQAALDGRVGDALRDLGMPLPADFRGTAIDAARDLGRAVPIPGRWTTETLAYDVGRLAGSEAHFQALYPPWIERPFGRAFVDTLLAWDRGRRLRGVTPNGDELDLPRVVAFLNAVLARGGSTQRAALLADGWVWVDDPEVLKGAHEQGLAAFVVPVLEEEPVEVDEPIEEWE